MDSLYRLISYYDIMTIQWYASRRRAREIAAIFRCISRAGNGELYLVSGILLWWLEPRCGSAFLSTGLIAYSIELVCYLVIKNTCKRARPFDHISNITPALLPSDKFSFPSGHTAAAFVYAGLVAWFYPDFAAPVFVAAGLIGISRVILCVHYPSDIVAGALLGAASTWGALAIAGYPAGI